MKLAYVYYYEFVNVDDIYRFFIKKSILSLLSTGICRGEDIFINIIGVNKDIHDEIFEFCKQHSINIYDVSNNLLHYYDYFKIDNTQEAIPLNNAHIRLYNHKFTNYQKIIDRGYDGIVQLDADIIFYENITHLFNITDVNTIYTMHVPSQYGTFDKARIENILQERDDNNVPLFSFSKREGKRFNFLKQVCQYLLKYNIDSFVDDIRKLEFWPSGGMYLFTKEVVQSHGDMLSLVNYLITKDDEFVVLLVSIANNIPLKTMDGNEISTFDIHTLKSNPGKFKIFHPGGRDQKLKILQDGLDKL